MIRAGSFNECGQGTVEFALVTAAFLAAVIALGALWRGLEAGMFVDHALMSASHHIQMTMPGRANRARPRWRRRFCCRCCSSGSCC